MELKELRPELQQLIAQRGLTLAEEEGLPVLKNDTYRFAWVNIGESILGGEYDPNCPGDAVALRFDVMEISEDDPDGSKLVSNGSFCTCVTDDTPFEELVVLLLQVYDAYTPKLQAGESCKKVGELLSWLGSNRDISALLAQELN